MKSITWLGGAKRAVLATSASVMHVIGHELERVQRGGAPTDSKPMTIVGKGVREIRVHVAGEHRVFYIATFPEAVYVLHVFEKKSQKTAARDIALGQQRYQSLLKERLRP